MLQEISCRMCQRTWWRTKVTGPTPRRCPPCRLRDYADRANAARLLNPPPPVPRCVVVCSDCGGEARTRPPNPQGGGTNYKRCGPCQLTKLRRKWRTALARKHGITLDRYEAILRSQGGTCAVPDCARSDDGRGRSLHIDHDHDCCPGAHSCGRCIRGLLCAKHNIGIGYFANDPADLRAAAAYLEARQTLMEAV